MAGNISKTKVVAATAQQPDANHIVVTYQGGQDAGTCYQILWSVSPDTGTTDITHLMTSGGPTTALAVGSSFSFDAVAASNSFAGRNHVVGVATFMDGSSQVILDNFI